MTASEGITTRVVRGGMWGMGGQSLALVASFVATPFVVRQLGVESYGVLALINLLIGYLSFTDVGMGEASTRFAAAAHERGDDAEEASIVWTTLIIAFVPSVVGALALVIGAEILTRRVFALPESLQAPAIVGFRIAALGFVARSVAGVLNTPQLVRLRLDLCTIINSGFGILQICLIPVVLHFGGGLIGAACVIAAAAVATATAHGILGLHLLQELSRPRFRRTLFAGLTSFGAAVAASALLSIALGSGEKLMLTSLATVTALAYYSIAQTFAGVLSVVPSALGQALMPAFARLGALPSRGPLQQLYARALRAMLFGTPPVLLMLCVIARPFFTVWAGPDFGRESTGPFYILAAGLLLNLIAFVPYRMLTALGRAAFIARYHALELVPHLASAALFTYWLGASGAALAWSLRQLAGAVVFLTAALRLERLRPAPLPANRLGFAAALSVLVVPVMGGLVFAFPFAATVAVAALSTTAYVCLVWTQVLSVEERAWVGTIVRHRRAVAGMPENGVAL